MESLSRLLALLSMTAFFVTGCGGGGGGGTSGITYSGVTTAAEVSQTNAADLADTAIYGATSSDTFVLSQAPISDTGEQNGVYPLKLAKTLTSVANRIDYDAMPTELSNKAKQSYSDTMPGMCAGSARISMSIDDVSGNFSGSMTFSNLDDCDGVILNGPVTLSGSINLSTFDFTTMTFNFKQLSSTTDQGTETLSGTVVVQTIGLFGYQSTMNMVFQDNTDKTFKLENYVTTLDESSDPATATITGRAYHPEYGYVNITTPTTLQIHSFDDNPYAGVIQLTGANGSAGSSTKATVTFTDNNHYTIDIDADGNGADESQLSCTWTPDVCL